MEHFELTTDLLTDISAIDEQHRKLFEFANELLDPATASQGPAALLQSLAFLGGYIEYHFTAEELLMREAGFPLCEQHRHLHEVFRAEVEKLAQEAHTGGVSPTIMAQIASLVRHWLLDHIRIEDRKFASFLVGTAEPGST